MRKIFLLIICFFIFLVPDVFASNVVDYKLVITKDYEFKETISYTLSDYEDFENGYNYYSSIVEDNIYTDIMYKKKYKKSKKLVNGTYYITLSNTFSEYSMSNSKFLNDCFEISNYDYDMDSYSFSGSGGFNCMYADKLTITVVTDFEVVSTNATVSGNKYVWTPNDMNFSMKLKLNKVYEESLDEDEDSDKATDYLTEEEFDEENKNADDTLTDENNNDSDVDNNNDDEQNIDDENVDDEEDSNNYVTYVVLSIIAVAILIVVLIAYGILKRKKNNLNQI